MKKNHKFLIAALCGISMLTSGCATIMGDKSQNLSINSNPTGTNFEVIDETGKVVHNGVTPAQVDLPKHSGSYFGKKEYKIRFNKDGYQSETVQLKTSANGLYVLGNFVFGGPVGWFLVDPNNGGMYNISPNKVDTSLVPNSPLKPEHQSTK